MHRSFDANALSNQRVLFALSCRFVREPLKISQLLHWAAIGKVSMGFLTTTKLVSPTSPHFGLKRLTNGDKSDFPISIWFRRQMWKKFRNRCMFMHFTMVSAHLDWQIYALYFKQLYLQNSCIDLHVWNTVGKGRIYFEYQGAKSNRRVPLR